MPEQACPYLPGRASMSRAFLCDRMPGELYHELMDAGFRRSGTYFYQPVCRGCRACQPIRVPVERFVPSKSQRRTWRKNQDLTVAIAPPQPTDEKFDLYVRYVRERHHRDEGQRPAWEEFLYGSPVQTLEFAYRDEAGALVAVGICDVCPRSLSSVYFYFDPAHARRGLGTFGALWEIEFARGQRIPYYYLGYFIEGCASMRYKGDFRPCELLGSEGAWREASRENLPAAVVEKP